MKNLLIGFGYPVAVILACVVASVVICQIGFRGRELALMQHEDAAAHKAAAAQAEVNEIVHGQSFSPVR